MKIIDKYRFPKGAVMMKVEESLEELNFDDQDALPQAVNELRRYYDEEEKRRRSVESKSGALVGVNTIILGIIQILGESPFNSPELIFSISTILASTVICLFNIRSRQYRKPIPIEDITSITGSEKTFNTFLYKKYFSSAVANEKFNDVKYERFSIAIYATIFGMILVGVHFMWPIVEDWINVELSNHSTRKRP